MKTKTQTHKFLRKRKFLIVLPLIVLPFITLLFWSLGGGNTGDVNAQQANTKQGINMQLPDANLNNERPLDKLSYYEKAASDSAKLEELLKNDPNYIQPSREDKSVTIINDSVLPSLRYKSKSTSSASNLKSTLYGNHLSMDPNEAKVYKKLEQLNQAMNQASVEPSLNTTSSPHSSRKSSTSMSKSDIDKLEQMMAMNRQDDGSDDPEMNRLNGMMEKILDIQHPERVKEKIQQSSAEHKGQVFTVNASSNIGSYSLLTNSKVPQANYSNRFYSIDEDVVNKATSENAISAVVHQSQIVVDGSIVKLRLRNDVFVNGNLIPKDNCVFGIASLNGERLIIKINSIRFSSSLYPVDLSVFDMDGLDGIYIPGAITRDVAKQSADRAVQGLGFTALDPSLKLQAATAGIEAAKTLLTKKAKLIKVMVKAGYQVLLRDEKQNASF